MRSEKFRTVFTVVRVAVGAGLIAFLLWKLDIQEIIGHLIAIDPGFLVYAVLTYLMFVVLSAWRWQILLDFKNFEVPFLRTLRIYFISLFFNNMLPTTVGGDTMRVIYTMKDRRADALAVVLVDRMLGFIGLFIVALIAVVYLLVLRKGTEYLPFMVIGFTSVMLATYIFFSRRAYAVLSPLVNRIKVMRLGERLNRLHEAGTDFGGAWWHLIVCVVLSVAIQATLSIAPFFVLRSMGYQGINLLPFFIYVPIINVISMIPLSLNGLGVRENSYVILFARAGVPGEVAMAMSLLSFFIVFVYSLAGGIFFMIDKRH